MKCNYQRNPITKQLNKLQSVLLSSLVVFIVTPVCAQITPDNTLGAENSRITGNTLINGASFDLINGGAQRGNNLFHSFSSFNVNEGQSVYFINPSGVLNIISRVTGASASNINGTLGVGGAANLFLINPNGILFGKNSSLDIRGSFIGTTANSLQFGNQGIFSATNPEAPPLLTINPSALLFNQINPGAISIQSQAPAGLNPNGVPVTGLRVPEGQSLLLVGGNINLDSGKLRPYDGNVQLAAISAPGTVGLNTTDNTFSLNVPNNIERGDISLQNQAAISTFGALGGNINIYARNLDISNSSISGGIGQGLGNINTQAGDVNLNATGAINLSQGSVVNSGTSIDSKGSGGNINITGNSLLLNNSSIASTALGLGNSGNININTKDNVTLDNPGNAEASKIFNGIDATGVGKAGDIQITTGNLKLNNASVIGSGVAGQGSGSKITINALSEISLTNGSEIINNIEASGVGNAGDIQITTNNLKLDNASEINSVVTGQGNGGKTTINALSGVSITDGSSIFHNVAVDGVGNAGNIELTTNNLLMRNQAFISSSNNGKGNAANIFINAQNLNVDGASSSIISNVFNNGSGKGGNIQIDTRTLSLTNGGQIGTYVAESDAGNIVINARDSVNLDGTQGNAVSGIQTQLLSGIGKSGDIQITTGSLTARNGATVSAGTGGQGNAGNITVNASGIVTLTSNGQTATSINTATNQNSVGKGGDIRINAKALFLQDGGLLLTNSFGQGNAGNISINTQDKVVVDAANSNEIGSGISTLATSGNGGDIEITTGNFSLINGSNLSSFVQTITGTPIQASAGSITINARDAVIIDGTNSNGLPSIIKSSINGKIIGQAGDIRIATKSFSVGNDGYLDSSTAAAGNAGNIIIDASDNITLNGANNRTLNQFTGIYSTVLNDGVGRGGDIRLTTKTLSATNGAQISATSTGQGNAGNIIINSSDNITLNGANNRTLNRITGIYSNVLNDGVGRGGDIRLTTKTLSATNGAQISAISTGQGNAGNIDINSGTVNLNNQSGITAVTSISDGGSIKLTADNYLLLRRGSFISTSAGFAGAGGNGGNITINTPFVVALPNEISDITAQAIRGNGGQVNINVQSLFGIEPLRAQQLPQSSYISASSQFGVQGQVNVTQPEVQPIQQQIELPGQILDASNQIRPICPRGDIAFRRPLGEFTVTGRGSLPPSPLEPLPGTAINTPLATLNTGTSKSVPISKTQVSPTPIIEAQGLIKTKDGTIELVAKAPTLTPLHTTTQATCPQI